MRGGRSICCRRGGWGRGSITSRGSCRGGRSSGWRGGGGWRIGRRWGWGVGRRGAVARALANRPKLVLADEPTGALDARNAQQVIELVKALCTEVGASLLLVTHDPAIVKRMPRAVTLNELNRAAVKEVVMVESV